MINKNHKNYQENVRQMLKKLLIFIILVALYTIASAGCSKKKEISATPKIAVVVSTLNNPWFVVLAETAAAKARELGYEVSIFDSQNDLKKESEYFDDIIVGDYKAILFNPTDADGSIASVKNAAAKGIPIFCMDRELNSNDVATAQILSDNYTGCVDIGKYFVEKVGDKGTYIEILGLPGDNNTYNRSKGFHSVVDNYPELKMVAQQSADFDRTKANEVTETLLQQYPGIKAVFCGNDAMAMGAYQALVASGKDKDIMIFGFDGTADVVDAIRAGKITATGMQYPKVMAATAAKFADQYIKGKRNFAQKIPVKVDLVCKETIDKFEAYGKVQEKEKPVAEAVDNIN